MRRLKHPVSVHWLAVPTNGHRDHKERILPYKTSRVRRVESGVSDAEVKEEVRGTHTLMLDRRSERQGAKDVLRNVRARRSAKPLDQNDMPLSARHWKTGLNGKLRPEMACGLEVERHVSRTDDGADAIESACSELEWLPRDSCIRDARAVRASRALARTRFQTNHVRASGEPCRPMGG